LVELFPFDDRFRRVLFDDRFRRVSFVDITSADKSITVHSKPVEASTSAGSCQCTAEVPTATIIPSKIIIPKIPEIPENPENPENMNSTVQSDTKDSTVVQKVINGIVQPNPPVLQVPVQTALKFAEAPNAVAGQIAIGYHAGSNMATNQNNIAIGYHAGSNMATNQNNIAIGYHAGSNMATNQNNIAIGTDVLTNNAYDSATETHASSSTANPCNSEVANTAGILTTYAGYKTALEQYEKAAAAAKNELKEVLAREQAELDDLLKMVDTKRAVIEALNNLQSDIK
jgi:hypothetical protein